MKLTPKARAYVAQVIVFLPYIVVMLFYRDRVSDVTVAYLVFLSAVASILVYQWIYHRATSRLPAHEAPAPELSLEPESTPRVVWLAAVPPILAAMMLWWVTLYGSDLPWRDTWLAPPTPAVTHSWYRTMALSIAVWNSFSLLSFVCALAAWHGMSRAYQYRRTMLLRAITGQWMLLIGSTAWAFGMGFRLPVAVAVVCAIAYSASLCVVIWNGWRVRDIYAASPRTGAWFYSDARDPAFLGPRGINLASAWCWVISVTGVAPLLLVQWILHHVQSRG